MVLVATMISHTLIFADLVNFESFFLEFSDTISNETNSDTDFGVVNHNYRISVYEITNAQFAYFAINNSSYAGANLPVNNVSWYEAAKFVNWLNTIKGYQVAYYFDCDLFSLWDSSVAADNGNNLYRHKDAVFFLPSEDEWVKAAYWNGTALQAYTKIDDIAPMAGADSNFYQTSPFVGPWGVGTGFREIHDTYDMMGNVWEMVESNFGLNYDTLASRAMRGGGFDSAAIWLSSSMRIPLFPGNGIGQAGFRVASKIPEETCINKPVGDLDGDCTVDLLDFTLFLNSWMHCGLLEGCPN